MTIFPGPVYRYTGSQVVKGIILKMTGQPVFIPLLKEIYMLRKNIRFRAFRIDTKANDLADPLAEALKNRVTLIELSVPGEILVLCPLTGMIGNFLLRRFAS